MPLVSFRSSLFKAFDDASPRRGTRRGGPLPTAPAHDARSRARTRAGDQDDPARARPRRRAFPPPSDPRARRLLLASAARRALRLVREKPPRRLTAPPAPAPRHARLPRASPRPRPCPRPHGVPRARAVHVGAGRMYYPYGSAVGPFYGCGFSRDARPSRPLDPPPTLRPDASSPPFPPALRTFAPRAGPLGVIGLRRRGRPRATPAVGFGARPLLRRRGLRRRSASVIPRRPPRLQRRRLRRRSTHAPLG